MAAVYATLLNLQLEDVPNFVTYGDAWFDHCNSFLSGHNYEYSEYVINPNRPDVKHFNPDTNMFPTSLDGFDSFDGYYDAVVISPGFFEPDKHDFMIEDPPMPLHAVVIDKDFNIVHDPNPGYENEPYPLADTLKFNGVIGVTIWSKKL